MGVAEWRAEFTRLDLSQSFIPILKPQCVARQVSGIITQERCGGESLSRVLISSPYL